MPTNILVIVRTIEEEIEPEKEEDEVLAEYALELEKLRKEVREIKPLQRQMEYLETEFAILQEAHSLTTKRQKGNKLLS